MNNPLPFAQTRRGISYKQRCQRFNEFAKGWCYSGISLDCILFSVNKPIELHGVEHFGSEGGEYTVKTDIVDLMNHTSLVSRAGNYTSERSDTHAYYGFEVLFDHPVILEANKEYEVKSLITGPPSWYGGDGQTSVECRGVQFTFHYFGRNLKKLVSLTGKKN